MFGWFRERRERAREASDRLSLIAASNPMERKHTVGDLLALLSGYPHDALVVVSNYDNVPDTSRPLATEMNYFWFDVMRLAEEGDAAFVEGIHNKVVDTAQPRRCSLSFTTSGRKQVTVGDVIALLENEPAEYVLNHPAERKPNYPTDATSMSVNIFTVYRDAQRGEPQYVEGANNRVPMRPDRVVIKINGIDWSRESYYD